MPHDFQNMTSPHAKAVLRVCDRLTASGHLVISANTDEAADPQIFSQSETGELAFYFVRTTAEKPTAEMTDRFTSLAQKHAVAAYYVYVRLEGEDSAPSITVSALE